MRGPSYQSVGTMLPRESQGYVHEGACEEIVAHLHLRSESHQPVAGRRPVRGEIFTELAIEIPAPSKWLDFFGRRYATD